MLTHERIEHSFENGNAVDYVTSYTEEPRRPFLIVLLFGLLRLIKGTLVLSLAVAMWVALFLFGTAIGRILLVLGFVVLAGHFAVESVTP